MFYPQTLPLNFAARSAKAIRAWNRVQPLAYARMLQVFWEGEPAPTKTKAARSKPESAPVTVITAVKPVAKVRASAKKTVVKKPAAKKIVAKKKVAKTPAKKKAKK